MDFVIKERKPNGEALVYPLNDRAIFWLGCMAYQWLSEAAINRARRAGFVFGGA